MPIRQCAKCGEFLGKVVMAHDPASGVTSVIRVAPHFCSKRRDAKGRFSRKSLVERMRPHQYTFYAHLDKLNNATQPQM